MLTCPGGLDVLGRDGGATSGRHVGNRSAEQLGRRGGWIHGVANVLRHEFGSGIWCDLHSVWPMPWHAKWPCPGRRSDPGCWPTLWWHGSALDLDRPDDRQGVRPVERWLSRSLRQERIRR